MLRGKSTGNLAALSVIDSGVCLSNPTPVSLSCLQHARSWRQHPPSLANSALSKQSIKTPARLAPPPFPSIRCTQTPDGSTGPDNPPQPLAPAIDWFLQ